MANVQVERPEVHTGRKRALIAAVALATGIGIALVPALQVRAAPVAPPTVEASVGFVVGSVVEHDWDPTIPWGVGYAEGYLDVAIDDIAAGTAQTWSVQRDIAGGPPTVLVTGATSSAVLTMPIGSTDYEDDFGGGTFQVTNWTVKASNGGGETVVAVPAGMDITQQDGTNARGIGAVGTVTTKGKWRTTNCKCFLGGTTQRNTKKWNWMQFTATVVDGQRIAVVMPLAENRGKARIRLDGVSKGIINTYSSVRVNRVITWQTPVLTAGTHTVRVVNLATPGHPRIDVDAFLVTTP